MRNAGFYDPSKKAKAPKGDFSAQIMPGHAANNRMTVALPVECYLGFMVVLFVSTLYMRTTGYDLTGFFMTNLWRLYL